MYKNTAASFFINYPTNTLDYIGEIEESNGWKVARISSLNPFVMNGLNYGIYTQSDKASCNFHKGHTAPEYGCDCGFYSFYTKSRAKDVLGYGRGLFLIKVENYGRIIQHQYGQRSAEQDIISCEIKNKCSRFFCRNSPTHLARIRNYYHARCNKHLKPDNIEISKLSMNTSIEFSFLDNY